MGLWAKKHQEAALALGVWVAGNPGEATALLNMDCTNRKQFKKKIMDALNNTTTEQLLQQGYGVNQHSYYPYRTAPRQPPGDGFAGWCRQFPKAAKKLRAHAKALCKTGTGVLNGSIK